MTKQAFWALIDQCRHPDTEEFFSSLNGAVTQLPQEELQLFQTYLGSYLEAASECIWLDMACKVINGYVSDDTALYFTLWVIAQGESCLLSALENPDSLAELPELPFGNAEFEMLMSVGGFGEEFHEAAFEGMGPEDFGVFDMPLLELDPEVQKKCGQEVQDSIGFRNGEKYGGYDSFEEAMEDIPHVLPKLIQRAEQAGFGWRDF